MDDQPLPIPYCCGQHAKWIIQTRNLKYYYCTICKKEVNHVANEPKLGEGEDPDFTIWGGAISNKGLTCTSS